MGHVGRDNAEMLGMIVGGVLISVGSIKAVDYIVSLFVIVAPRSRLAWCVSKGRHFRDPAWTPVFFRAARHRQANRAASALAKLIDVAFRLPVLCTVQAVAALAALEIAHPHSSDFLGSSSSTDVIWLAVAVASVAGAIGSRCSFSRLSFAVGPSIPAAAQATRGNERCYPVAL
jgi:hypothetical protein